MVQTLAAAGELQRDLQRELTYDGLRAAEAKGNKGGRRPAIPAEDRRRAYRAPGGPVQSPPWPANTASAVVGHRRPDAEHTAAGHEDAPPPELPITLDMPGKVADFLRTTELEPAERAALDHGVTVRRGRRYTLRISTVPAVHRGLLARCQPLDGAHGLPVVPAQRKVRREYENRVSTLGTAVVHLCAETSVVPSTPASVVDESLQHLEGAQVLLF